MSNYEDLYADDGHKFYISLSKLLGGVRVADVHGYLTSEFGDTCFKVCHVVLEDGREIGVEGEHDFPYLSPYAKWPVPPLDDDEEMERIKRSDPDFEEYHGHD